MSTTGEAATTAGSTSSQSRSMTVATITNQPRIDTEVEQTSHSLWRFLIGFAIAAAAGLILLFRRSLLRAR
jgi:ABC-type nitrate/sulfonate/bicarbonate transport system permease component